MWGHHHGRHPWHALQRGSAMLQYLTDSSTKHIVCKAMILGHVQLAISHKLSVMKLPSDE